MFCRLVMAATLLLPIAALADDESSASPEAIHLIETLGLRESSTPSRDLPNWAPPRHVAVFIGGSLESKRESILEAVRGIAGRATVTGINWDSFDLLKEAEAVLAFCTPELLEAAPNLRFLHSYWVGVERCTLDENIGDYEFVLTNNQRLSGPDIAEHTIGLMFALARNFTTYQRQQHQGSWQSSDRHAINLHGRTLLVLGLGGIGTEIARRANALGMRVIATRNSSRSGPPFVDYFGLSDETHELAAQADFIANALPLTRSTQGLVDSEFFATARTGAFYISVGRGRTTDTDALVAALRSGKIAGAGLDVTDPEPLPKDHPLWTLDNVVITPHVSADTKESRQRALVIAIENLRRYSMGEPLLSVVDLKRGY